MKSNMSRNWYGVENFLIWVVVQLALMGKLALIEMRKVVCVAKQKVVIDIKMNTNDVTAITCNYTDNPIKSYKLLGRHLGSE